MLMLALLRHVPAAFDHVKFSAWNSDLFKGKPNASTLCSNPRAIRRPFSLHFFIGLPVLKNVGL